MRILILGGDGMLGHELRTELARAHEIVYSLRQSQEGSGHSTATGAMFGVDVRDGEALERLISTVVPDVVVNAVGIIKQRDDGADAILNLEVNALLPHRLSVLCAAANARLIHISTDCVFAGTRGGYREEDVPDASDFYGRSKLLGEVAGRGCLTLRSSIIGLELKRRISLVEWYLRQTGKVSGFTKAIFSGLTTMEFARLIHRLIVEFRGLDGLYHVASEPISKYELLRRLTVALGRTDVSLIPVDDFHMDRSLIGERFALATGYRTPTWDTMLNELAHRIRERQGQ